MKQLLIVYHSNTGNTQRLALAAYEGAQEFTDEVNTRLIRAFDTTLEDLLNCDGLLLGTPENFGYMSGALKDFFDRTFYPAQGQLVGLPYSVFISAGNDGSNALAHIERIARGYPFKPVCEPLICKGPITTEAIQQANEIGQTLAAGIAFGIF